MHKVEQNAHTHTQKNPPSVPSSNAIVSVNFLACRFNLVVLSSKVGEKVKKKESGDSSENGICSCGFPAHCCQLAVAGCIIYAHLWGELSTHLDLQALFTESSVREPLLHAFPFPSTLGRVTMHPLSQACMFIYSSCGKWVFPRLLCRFPPIATFTRFPAPDYWPVLLLLPAMFVYSSRGKWVFPPLL
jgi:hypothetical protein